VTEDVAQKAKQRSFTGDKLDWMTALCADPRLSLPDFKIGFCIAQHVNSSTGVAILSDDTLVDKTNINRRSVIRSRINLKKYGWIDWKRTMTHNVYWTLGTPMDAISDHQTLLKDGRDERRQRMKSKRKVVPKLTHLKARDVTPPALTEVSKVADS
jgi:hypothetical protein